MWNKKYLWILIPIIIVLVGGGFYYYTTATASTEEAEDPSIQTAVARQGDIIVFASGAGQIVPATEIALGFDENGTLSEMLVQVGEEVQVGQVLARLQTGNSTESIAASIAEADLDVFKAQQALDAIYENADIETAEALTVVEVAQSTLDDLMSSELQRAQAWEAVVEAEEAVEDAEYDYNSTFLTASQANIDAAWADIVLTEDALDKAEDNFAPYANKPDDNLTKANLQAELSAAQQNYDSAVREYNAMIETGTELDQSVAGAEFTTAQAQLADAQREWERVKDGPSAGEIALAEADLAAAQTQWELLKDGPDPEEIALAELELANAKAQLILVLKEQAVIELVAPIDGTVLNIYAGVGEYVSTIPILTLADLEQPLLEVYLDETDLDKVAVGFEVEVVFDALPNEIFAGHVIQVDPSLETISGVQAIRTLVSLDADSFAKPQILPVGLNASVDVIGGRAEGAVLIPVEALRELGPDEYAVFVLEDGEAQLRIVTVGLMDFTSVEIISGLDTGEIVTTGIVETK
jgi:HlyD family secretion protein